MVQISSYRRMPTILAADVAGFSALMEHDDVGTCVQIALLRREIVEPILADNRGCLIETMESGFLAEFESPLEALRCGISIQLTLADATDRLQLRIGLNFGDAIVENIRVAARLEAVADPGGILISGNIYDEVIGKIDARFEDRGELRLENTSQVVRMYAVIARAGGCTF
jgi:adenylate cyclase